MTSGPRSDSGLAEHGRGARRPSSSFRLARRSSHSAPPRAPPLPAASSRRPPLAPPGARHRSFRFLDRRRRPALVPRRRAPPSCLDVSPSPLSLAVLPRFLLRSVLRPSSSFLLRFPRSAGKAARPSRLRPGLPCRGRSARVTPRTAPLALFRVGLFRGPRFFLEAACPPCFASLCSVRTPAATRPPSRSSRLARRPPPLRLSLAPPLVSHVESEHHALLSLSTVGRGRGRGG